MTQSTKDANFIKADTAELATSPGLPNHLIAESAITVSEALISKPKIRFSSII